ncbi:TPA: hypothetical protein HA318_00820 [Candidatus Micrarchaeota archaeon]|nr:MAG: hypothetical protein AUJ65_03710 [Candidatus Micrarchaeota archaeon CG1_02_51_15]HII38530.1 hypothetical protein [Candidatus Micrarchaeota archaeon]
MFGIPAITLIYGQQAFGHAMLFDFGIVLMLYTAVYFVASSLQAHSAKAANQSNSRSNALQQFPCSGQ